MSKLKEALYEQAEKVFTAFVTWGIGMMLMLAYCVLVFLLNQSYSLLVTIAGALVFLTVAYFLIDLWWNFKGTGFRE